MPFTHSLGGCILKSAVLLVALGSFALAQTSSSRVSTRKPLTWEAIYGDDREDFEGSIARGMTWLGDGRHYLHRRDGQLMRIDAETGEAAPAYDVDALEAVLLGHKDFEKEQAERLAKQAGAWTDDRDGVLLRSASGLYFYRFSEDKLRKLTSRTPSASRMQLSAGGDAVTYVRDNDLYFIDTGSGREKRLTRDGSETLLNGVLDWVYQEEIYGRGRWRGHWQRDDAKYVAFLQLDESPVDEYALVDYMPLVSRVEHTRYPKAGTANPKVRLGIARTSWRHVIWADLSKYDGTDILIVHVSWTPEGNVLFSVQDREQTWLDLDEANRKNGRVRTVLHEESPAWVEHIAHPHWLADGSFLWLSERDGYRHVYHYAADGALIGRVTEGSWSVQNLAGCDEEAGLVYFTGCRETAFETHAYRVPLAGGRIERLTQPGYTHSVNFDPQLRYFFDEYSNSATPSQVALRRSDGSLVRTISENHLAALVEYEWGTPDIRRISNRDGAPMNVEILRPTGFEASRKYPVVVPVYGAPGTQAVRNSWGGRQRVFDQYLAQQGYLVFRIDPHTACGAGAQAAWQAYGRLGEVELADIEDGLRWLADQGYADSSRVGIIGYSYGGFMAAYALTHSTMFKLGVAGAPVTDWRNYDSVYTERFMRTPANNCEGYDRASVTAAAGDLHGKLLIVHGFRDDNVHFQNTAQFIDALEAAGEEFDLMIYPRDRHSLGSGAGHYRALQRDYILNNL